MSKSGHAARLYRGRFRRLLELDEQIRRGEYPNTFSFAQQWEVSRKTVVRDVEFLRYSLGAPIAYDSKHRGYYYTDPTWSLQQVELSEGELLLLLVARRMAERYKGTPLAGTLETLFEKLQAVLPNKVTIDPAIVTAQVSFYGYSARPISEEIWQVIFRALRNNWVINFLYKNPEARKANCREVEPIHLVCIADEWYLIGFDRGLVAIRHFAISRIKSVSKEITDQFKPRDFDPDSYFSNRFGRFVGSPGQHYAVEVRFSSETAIWITEREWSPKQRIRRHRDGSLTLSFPAPSLYEAKRWILQWGAEAEVLKPKQLREEILEELDRWKRRYQASKSGQKP